ncbi:MAG: glutamate--tRNA ligase family protein, partial [Ignavibacteria bacterium]
EALLNFMALLGWNPGEGEEKEIFSKEELIEKFNIERVNSAGAVFNVEKLNWMNGEYIKNYDIDKLTELVIPYLNSRGIDTSDLDKTKRVIFAIKNYISKLDESGEHAEVYYKEVTLTIEQSDIVSIETSKQVFAALMTKIEPITEITVDNFKPMVSEVQKDTGVKGKNLFMPLRLALTAEEHGPELGLIAYVLGKDEVLKRLMKVV